MSTSEIHGPQYHPRSVTVVQREGKWCVVDRSYAGTEHVARYPSYGLAMHHARVRRGVIKAALTRRANKRQASRVEACKAAGVTWSWLREDLTAAEADAWLGIDR